MTQIAAIRVCRLEELALNAPAAADLEGRRVTLVRTGEREVHCIDDTCSHANVSLAEGEVDDCHIECWLHGSRFDLRTGVPDVLPATEPVAVHRVTIEGDDVFVTLSSPRHEN